MNFALVYIGWRTLHRFAEFFRHWYVVSFYLIGRYLISFLERLDRTLAFRITLKYLFQPLYQDYTVIGYILGFIFRSFRLVVGGAIYAVVILVALGLYLAWLLIPVYIISRIVLG
ncbi:MAG: hypothetical protein Q8Q41_00250 [bacterium]|nr:hypothetical protein [bacterium]